MAHYSTEIDRKGEGMKQWLIGPFIGAFSLLSLWCLDTACTNTPPAKLSCSLSQACLHAGLCSTDKQERCFAETEIDCRQSTLCQESGNCVPVKGECTHISEGYCKQSVGCQKLGNCGINRAKQRCFADKDQDCQNSKACQVSGRCVLKEGMCVISEAFEGDVNELVGEFPEQDKSSE